MVVAGEVQEAVKQEDLQFGEERVSRFLRLARGGLHGYGQVAGQRLLPVERRGGREGQHVGRLVFAAPGPIHLANMPISGEQDRDLAAQPDGLDGLFQKCCKEPPP